MAFKIGTLSVSVVPEDSGFEEELRAAIDAATDGVKAEVALRLNPDALLSLDEDVHAAIDAATDGVKAQVGLGLKDDAVEALDADVKAGIDLVEADAKVKISVDPQSGAEAQQGISTLIAAAMIGGAAIGAPALLAGMGLAFVGVEALALKSNAVISADYSKLGKDAESALTQAVAPAAATMHQAVTSLDADVTKLKPTLDTLFANVTPDILTVTSGIEAFTGQALGGMSKALGSSQVIVADFSQSLGPLGSGVGSFFTGMTRDANTEGAGLQSFIGVLGNTFSTLGTVAGSASTALSADLLALDPAINGVLTGVRALANPATVGGLVGAFGAMKLDPVISSGLKSASGGMLDLASKTEGAEGMLGKFSGAALAGGSGLEKMANVMGGPWGIAVGAGVGILSGLVGSLLNAADATQAVTLSQQDLQTAITKDGDAAGTATAAFVAAQLATSGLSNTAAAAGVSTATWTQAVLGNDAAQQQVIDTVNKANKVQVAQALSTQANAQVMGKYSQEQQDASTVADASMNQHTKLIDQTTLANQKLINSMQAQTQEVADTISADSKYEAMMDSVDASTSIFAATLIAANKALVANAQTTALNTVGALGLNNASGNLTDTLYQTVTAYNESAAEGTAYGQVLTALSGTTTSLLATEAAFTTSLAGVTAAVKANGVSLDVNTAKGAANITSFTGISAAADKAATAVYQNEVTTRGAGVAWDDANAKLSQEKIAFENAAVQAGFNKKAVDQLADSLFKLPTNVPVTIKVNTGNAAAALGSILQLESEVASAGANVAPQQFIGHRATGGPGIAGQPLVVGDGGRPEVFVPDTDGYIYPSVQRGQQAINAHNTQVAASSGAAPFGSSTVVNQHFYGSVLPSIEQRATLRREMAVPMGPM